VRQVGGSRRATLAMFAVVTMTFGTILTGCNAHVRAVVVEIGDSNGVAGAGSFVAALSDRDNGYEPVMLVRGGAAIRSPDCATADKNCVEHSDFWKIRLPEAFANVQPDAIVVELGINDTMSPGTDTTRGYAGYDGKIDYLMQLLPAGTMVLWTNLPCALEPAANQTGCAVVNAALAAAPARWPQLTMLDWSAAAAAHAEYFQTNDVHLTSAGQDAYAKFVAAALDARIPDPSGTTTTVTSTSTTTTSTSTSTSTTTTSTTDTTDTTVPDTTPSTDTTVPDTTPTG